MPELVFAMEWHDIASDRGLYPEQFPPATPAAARATSAPPMNDRRKYEPDISSQ